MLRFKPSDFGTFTDRDTQIAAFHQLLSDSAQARVYVVSGLSGNGKSFLVDYLVLHELPQGTPMPSWTSRRYQVWSPMLPPGPTAWIPLLEPCPGAP